MRAQDFWDSQAPTFDDEPDHGLQDPTVQTAWANLLLPQIPPPPGSVIDLGCGTGSLAVLLAQAGHTVQGLDLSPRMIAAAKAKATNLHLDVDFQQGDASTPPFPPASCDVVLARHVLWALPDPATALHHWTRLLRPGGKLVLIEGRWSTGSGLTASECQALVLTHRREATVRHLDDPALWGKPVDDERYLLISPA
ncbi:class I SAM-dependent methyltransferase [Umezawaea sp. Da 62-37]|uniref:class I SAM-dependent methyltransferase n=1 Tax=Umezawaea sp. Da 62-37 TaxID=3075927 RepID=UPI0028F6E976|nr:class I SAM-dependent methyltransferase [Umezawaea sp. Da 62-37]WNV86869.1 class I SAM-dependent methyltransferase [Umezawaea sp. Da 62-37]